MIFFTFSSLIYWNEARRTVEIMLNQSIQSNVNGRRNNKVMVIKSGTKNANTLTAAVVAAVKNRTTNILRKPRSNKFLYNYKLFLLLIVSRKDFDYINILRDKLFLFWYLKPCGDSYFQPIVVGSVVADWYIDSLFNFQLIPYSLSKNNTILSLVMCLCW